MSHNPVGWFEIYFDDLRLHDDGKFLDGPSIAAVKDDTEGLYEVTVENITSEGFECNADKPTVTSADARPGRWSDTFKKWKADRGIATPAREKKAKGKKKG